MSDVLLSTETARILAADDEAANLRLLKRALDRQGGYEVTTVERGDEVLPLLDLVRPHVVLLDLMMPGMDGMAVLRAIRSSAHWAETPVLILTAVADGNLRLEGLDSGANDYLFKPFNIHELRARVRSLVRFKRAMDALDTQRRQLADQKVMLEALVAERTADLEKVTLGLVAALEKANELNDGDTGNHIRRVCEYSEVIAVQLGLEPEMALRIKRYASLHDVGKVGIRDAILKKPGKLTPEEFEEMKTHTVIGAELLEKANADPIARNIALCHHERWDGRGYPRGLSGADIPVEARIVTVADVFDALCTKRVYKDAFPIEVAEAELRQNAGAQFDPGVVEAFFQARDAVRAIYARYPV